MTQDKPKVYCAGCKSECVPRGCTTGYGEWDGLKFCFACCDKIAVENLKDRSQKYIAYLSGDGKSVTTWTGGKLGEVIRSNTIRLNRVSYTHGKYIQSVKVRDVHGKHWVGQSSPGIAIRLRPCA